MLTKVNFCAKVNLALCFAVMLVFLWTLIQFSEKGVSEWNT